MSINHLKLLFFFSLLCFFPGLSVGQTLLKVEITQGFHYMNGGEAKPARVLLTQAAPKGGVTVSLSGTSPCLVLDKNVTIPAGQREGDFVIGSVPVSKNVNAMVNATLNGITVSCSILVYAPASADIYALPLTVIGGTSVSVVAKINCIPGPGGFTFGLSYSDPALMLPSSVTIPEGSTEVTLTVQTNPVAKEDFVAVTITTPIWTQVRNFVRIEPANLTTITLAPAKIVGGVPYTGSVTLNGPAAAGGAAVLLSSNSKLVTVPVKVIIPAGSTSASFPITTDPVAVDTDVKITSKFTTNARQGIVKLVPPDLFSFSLSPTAIKGGASSVGTVTLNGPCPSGNVTVDLYSVNPSISIPKSVTILAGSSSGAFTVASSAVTSNLKVNIAAVYRGITIKSTLALSK